MNLYYDQDPIPGPDAAIARFGPGEFGSPFRSTVPLLSYLQYGQDQLRALLERLSFSPESTLHLEYTVPVQRGRGTPSHTDLMVISEGTALAIEAKWTEPRYETVAQWLGDSRNRREVLMGWLGLLQYHARRHLRVEDLAGAVYQMVHRAASACAAGGRPALAYLLFEPSPVPGTATSGQIEEDLRALRELLDCRPGDFPFYVIEVPMVATPAFEAPAHLSKGAQTTQARVIAALRGDAPLFAFGPCSVTRVGEAL